jgi:RHS repeat-associated protein
MTKFTAGSNVTTFSYDADGRRVLKSDSGTSNTVTTSVYDAMGQLAAEYSTGSSPVTGTTYLTSDSLGSIRLITDGTGGPIQRFDYAPFGETLPGSATYANRNLVASYSGNSGQPVEPMEFTGKERDAATEGGLDYFGARYFSSAQGKWTSPDWSEKPQAVPYANLSDPQTLNLYAYVRNNPLSRRDPDGHIDCSGKNAQGVGCQYIANYNAEHGISSSAKKSDAPGVPVVLPNGAHVPDPHSPTGYMMSPTADLSDVAAAGRQTKTALNALNSGDHLDRLVAAEMLLVTQGVNLGIGGNFDYQRVGPQGDVVTGGFQQLPQFRDVSNFNVGLLSQQAGLTLEDTLRTAGAFAHLFSGNYSPDSPYGLSPQTADFIKLGYQAGATVY